MTVFISYVCVCHATSTICVHWVSIQLQIIYSLHLSDLKLVITHRYEHGIKQAVIDDSSTYIAHVADNNTCAVTALRGNQPDASRDVLDLSLLDERNVITCVTRGDSE